MKNLEKKSGYVGVSYIKRAGKYLASGRVDGKRITAGYFADPKEAALARDAAMRKAGCTDESRMNFPKEIEVKEDIHMGSPDFAKEYQGKPIEAEAEKEIIPKEEPDITITEEHRKAECWYCKIPYVDLCILHGGVLGRCNGCDSFHYIVPPSAVKV